MNYSDDKINPDKPISEESENRSEVVGNVDKSVAASSCEKSTESEYKSKAENADGNGGGGAFELAAVAVKSIAVTVAFILLLTSVLAVCLPLSAMRVYNKLGFAERAVDFGERYINRELKSYDAVQTDELGNYRTLSRTAALSNDDFTEALYVCINNSYVIMNECLKSGDTDRCAYYAELTEKYTRMYSSLNGVNVLNTRKSEDNIAAMPLLEMRPIVYSYGHTVRNMNFRARSILNKTDNMLFNSNEDGNAVTTFTERTNTLYGINIQGSNRDNLMSNLDMYIDYIDGIGEYLDVEFIRAGLENDVAKKVRYYNKQRDEYTEGYVYTESFVQNMYTDCLSGNEFPLLISKSEGGFTTLFERMSRFTEFAQAAVDFRPDDRNNRKLDEQLHQLYWLQTLSATSTQLWYLAYVLYYNRDMFGAASSAIAEKYQDLIGLNTVKYDGRDRLLSELYAIKLNEFKAAYNV